MTTTQNKPNRIEEVRAKLQAQAERVAHMESQAVRGGRKPASRATVAARPRVSQRRIANGFLIALLLILIGGTGGVLYSTYTTYLDAQSIKAAAHDIPPLLTAEKFKRADFGSLLRAAVKNDASKSKPIEVATAKPVHQPEALAAVVPVVPVAEVIAEPTSTPEPAPSLETAHESEPAPITEVAPVEPALEEAPAPAAIIPEPEKPAEPAPEAQPAPQPEPPAEPPAPAPEEPSTEPQPEEPSPAPEPPPAPRVLPFAP